MSIIHRVKDVEECYEKKHGLLIGMHWISVKVLRFGIYQTIKLSIKCWKDSEARFTLSDMTPVV